MIVNLETTLTHRPPYTGYPCFRSPAALADALRDAGVDVAVLANNHCCDGGAAGVHTTVAELRRCGIRHTGRILRTVSTVRPTIRFGSNTAACASLLNFHTYGTNGIPVPEGVRVNLIDTVRMAADLAAAREDRRTASRSASTGGTNTNGRRMPNSGGRRAFCAATART